jgi:hypothetical protein
VLALLADAEALKDNQEDEEIVHAERGFNGVAAHPLKRRLRPCVTAIHAAKAVAASTSRPSQPRKQLRIARLAPMAGQQGIGLIDQPDRLHEHIAVDGQAVGADLVHRVLRGVVVAVVGAVVEVDHVDRRHAALHKGQVIVFDGFFGLEEIAVVAEFVRRLRTRSTSQPVEWVSR